MKSLLRFNLLVIFAVLASGLAAAQDQTGDPPSRVARLQFMDGQVSLQTGGVDDWVSANLNRPLTTADRIWTDKDSRAELTMASAALRMGNETSVTLTNLDDTTAQIELDQGTLELSVRYLNPGEIVEVDTPNFAYTLSRPGEYRFDVQPDQDQSWITVRRGDGEATGQANAVRVSSGQQFGFSQGQSLTYTTSGLPPRDGFDDWCEVRERRETSSPSAGYVAAGTVGYEDLDDNGYWQPTPVYGAVWYPRMHAGWAPYHEGHWAWVEPWGWTWVDDAPWGFAPFHYGRWVFVGDRWGWVPGPTGVRPVYAPALVAWVGGPSFGVSVGMGGGVGWFPLGWHDPYLPAYHVSAVYARNVNISNSRVVNVTVVNNYYTTTNVTIRNTTINNIRYENSVVRGAVTGVSSSAFASGQPVARNAIVIPANAVGHVTVMSSAAIVPTRAAVLGGRPPAAVPMHMVAPRQVVFHAAPPPRPVSFEQQRPMLERNNGVPLAPAERASIRAANPAPAPRGGMPAGNAPAVKTNPPAGNPTFGHTPAPNAPAVNHPATNQPNNAPNTFGRPATQPTTPGSPVTNHVGTPANGVPPTNVPRPPATNSAPTNQGSTNPGAPKGGTTYQASPLRPGTPANTTQKNAPVTNAPVTPHTTPPARTADSSGTKRNTPPPPKENKEKEKER